MENENAEEAYDDVEVKIGSAFRKQFVEDTTGDPFALEIDKEINFVGLGTTMRKQKERLRKAFTGHEGTGTKARHEVNRPYTGYGLFDVAEPKYNLSALKQLMNEDYTHYAAIRAKAANVVGLGFDLIDSHKTRQRKDDLDGSEKLQDFRRNLAKAKSKVFEWLEGLNAEDTFDDILEKVYIDYEAMGNGYLEIGRTESGRIGYVGHIPAETIRVRNKRDGFVQIAQPRAVFFRNFGDTTTADPINSDPRPNEIIHFKNYNPNDLYYGQPDILPALRAVAGNKFSDEYNLDYFENKAVPRHVVVVKGSKLGPGQQASILKFFDEDLRGNHHRTLYVALPADAMDRKSSIDITPVESGIQEASFSDYRHGNILTILMVHGVPATKVGIVEGVDLAVARDADKTFKEQKTRPLQRKFEKRITKIINDKTDVFRFKFHELSLSDETQQAAIDKVYAEIGAVLPNEIRERWGKPGLKGGDKTLIDRQEAAARVKQTPSASSDSRESARGVNAPDTNGEARNPKGAGRQQG